MRWYPWLRPDFEKLVASYQAGRGHHALLIQALPGMGDDALIYALSRYLLCQQPQGHKSCGHCRGCQLMQAGTHPDYYTLAPEKGKNALGIDAVREVTEKLNEHARLGGAKVVWVTDAALLTDAAANALLKTLEEPPAETWFFLATREPERLLATLRSRCRLHYLAPPPEQYAVIWLSREVTMSQDALLAALRLSAGSPGAALALFQGDKGMHEATPWYAADYDDSNWTETDLFTSGWATNGLNTVNGSHWFRKDFQVSAQQAGEKATLRLGCIVDADSVYVNGTFVGTVSYQYPPRIYTIPAGLLKAGKNTITIRLFSYGGRPQFVKEKPYKILFGKGQPEKGESEINLEGSWKYHLGAPMPAAPGQTAFHYKPTGLYNAMIAPLLNYTVSGVIWYQGESNVSRRNEYKDLLTAMISDWRQRWNKSDMPFYIIELADFLSPTDKGGRTAWAEFRKAQAEVADTNKNVTLIKNRDLGEWNDIHPLDKKTLGQRVAAAILIEMNTKNRK